MFLRQISTNLLLSKGFTNSLFVTSNLTMHGLTVGRTHTTEGSQTVGDGLAVHGVATHKVAPLIAPRLCLQAHLKDTNNLMYHPNSVTNSNHPPPLAKYADEQVIWPLDAISGPQKTAKGVSDSNCHWPYDLI